MTLPRRRLHSSAIETRAFVWLLVGVTAAFALILWPFSGAVLWAIAMAIVFMPLQLRLLRRTGGRATLSALLTLGLVLLIVILPTALVLASLVTEAAGLYERMRTGELNLSRYLQHIVEIMPTWLRQLLSRFGLGNFWVMQQKALAGLGQSGQAITSQAFLIGQNTLELVVGFFVMLYLLFFLLRDGPALASQVGAAVPLNAHYRSRLFSKFVTVVRATVKGNILVAIIQGTLGGIAFAVIGIPAALLWGTVMAFLSLLPAVGAALVWAPVALYLLTTGEPVAAVALFAWGVLVIGLVDNLLRPFLVGKDTRLPDYLVMLSTVGGMAVFGINGFVIGPVIAAMFVAAWDIYTEARHEADQLEGKAASDAPVATEPPA